MKPQDNTPLLIEPQVLLVDISAALGESVFRLVGPSADVPALAIASADSEWKVVPMVKEGDRGYYVALRLDPGRYYYHFRRGDVTFLDPFNPGTRGFLGGHWANVLDIPRECGEIHITNQSRRAITMRLEPSNPIVEYDAAPTRLKRGETKAIPVLLRMNDSRAVPDAVEVQVVEDGTGETMGSCLIASQPNPTAPSLKAELQRTRDGRPTTMRLQAYGKGRIRCHIVDRIAMSVHVCTLGSADGQSCAEYTYPLQWQERWYANNFMGIPAIEILSDSPFPQERELKFYLREEAERGKGT